MGADAVQSGVDAVEVTILAWGAAAEVGGGRARYLATWKGVLEAAARGAYRSSARASRGALQPRWAEGGQGSRGFGRAWTR